MIPRLGRFLALTVFAPVALHAGSAAAAPELVIDASTGQVLHAQEATDPWFPASVTKLMTAYVALREVRNGRLTMDTPLVVSARAAKERPSKMGFKPGTQVTLENALRMIMVKSANDVSVTIAEGVGGSVEGFSDMMNREAARLGMRESRFVNPNGLPDDRMSTSARDMAILARAILMEFPEHEDLWGIGAIRHGKRVMQNTNGLIGRYPGADGMKTGFICASGFNVVASASRGGRRIIAVVMGSPSAAERTIRTAELFDRGFAGSGWGFGVGRTIYDLPAGVGTPPNLRPEICGKRRAPSEEEGEVVLNAVTASAAHDSNPALAMLAAPVPAASTVRGDGGRRTLGPRARFEPITVYTGPAPGSKAVARGPGAPAVAAAPAVPTTQEAPAAARAFAPARPAAPGQIAPVQAGAAPLSATTSAPILLQGAVRGGQSPSAPSAAPARPAAAAAIGAGARPTQRQNAGGIARTAKPQTVKPKPAARAESPAPLPPRRPAR